MATAPAVTGLCWALCVWRQARRASSGERPYVDALPASGILGAGLGPRPLRMAWLGDSLGAGLGCDHVADTPAHLTARLLERAVDLSVLAVPGARVHHVLAQQLPQLEDPDLVVLSVGANDVASFSSRGAYTAALDTLLARLHATPVVLLSLPDLTMADRMAQPLRSLAGARARWFEQGRAQVAAAHDHVTSVDVASRPAGLSRRAGREMLCADRFHPGPEGYRLWAARIATVCHQILTGPDQPAAVD